MYPSDACWISPELIGADSSATYYISLAASPHEAVSPSLPTAPVDPQAHNRLLFFVFIMRAMLFFNNTVTDCACFSKIVYPSGDNHGHRYQWSRHVTPIGLALAALFTSWHPSHSVITLVALLSQHAPIPSKLWFQYRSRTRNHIALRPPVHSGSAVTRTDSAPPAAFHLELRKEFGGERSWQHEHRPSRPVSYLLARRRSSRSTHIQTPREELWFAIPKDPSLTDGRPFTRPVP